MFGTAIFLLLAPALVIGDPLTFSLGSLNTKSRDFQVEKGSKLFVSSQVSSLLANINFLVNGQSISAKILANKYIPGSELKDGFVINSDKLTVTNTNPAAATAALKGVFYVTTAAQAQDPNFVVLDNLSNEIIKSDGGSKTYVIFNMFKSGSNDKQPDFHASLRYTAASKDCTMTITDGIPQPSSFPFFQNPVEFYSSTSGFVRHFFSETEVLPIDIQVFHVSITGPGYFSLSPTWASRSAFTTTLTTTTGVLSTTNGKFLDQRVNFTADLKKNGYVYVQYSGDVSEWFRVVFEKPGVSNYFSVSDGRQTGSHVESQLYSSMTLTGPENIGQFYAQYVVIEGTD